MAFDRFPLARNLNIKFYKLLGCGHGENFLPSDADPRRWGLLICIDAKALGNFDSSKLVMRWRKRSSSEFRAILNPISSHGQWSGKQPFDFHAELEATGSGIAAITRAKITWRQYPRFLRAIPSVNENLQIAPGRIASFGIGEAPIGLQGTFSLWETSIALRDFAFKGAAHAQAITDTEKFKWYSEELFARFDVVEIRGFL